jgi:Flp pilus assembly protein TadD
MWQAFAYVQKGMTQEAIAAAREAEQWAGADRGALAHAGHIYGRLGMKEEAVRVLTKLEEGSKDNPAVAWAGKAMVYAGLGDNDQASHGWTRLSNRGVPVFIICGSFPRMDRCATIRASRICCAA